MYVCMYVRMYMYIFCSIYIYIYICKLKRDLCAVCSRSLSLSLSLSLSSLPLSGYDCGHQLRVLSLGVERRMQVDQILTARILQLPFNVGYEDRDVVLESLP